MSGWNAYIDNLTASADIDQAGIYGIDGSTWAVSSGMKLSADEAKALIGGFSDTSTLSAGGIKVGGEKYLFVRGDDERIIGKSKKGGVVAMKTNQAVVVACQVLAGDSDSRKVENCLLATSKVADYLKDQNY